MKKAVLLIITVSLAGAGLYFYTQSPGPTQGDTSPETMSLTASYTGSTDLEDNSIRLEYIEAEKVNSSVTSYPQAGNRTYRLSELENTEMASFSLPEGTYVFHLGFRLEGQGEQVYNEISDTTYGTVDTSETKRLHIDINTRNQEGDRLIVSPQLDYRDQ